MAKINTLQTALNLTLVLINGVDVSKYLSTDSKISWYDVSKDSGRETTNGNGDMILNIINDKYRLDLVTRVLTDEEVAEFFAPINSSPTMTVTFLNPFTNSSKTITCYRGDRIAGWKQPYNGSMLYSPFSQALIQL